uniref:WD repeat-containing protein 91 isoform X2 n=1 Tax=Doryrhamphus excisus TaxID=161450 RepID=UPI0025AE4B3E|nr:WD repeat-containing protein 91 isoform X2 [Doryrhamphus excisus]
MGSAVERTDEHVREYLIYRGFTNTLKHLDSEMKADKEKGFRVDKIIDQLLQFIQSFDLTGLKDYWLYLDRRLFCRLEDVYRSTVNKLRASLYRYYVVNTIQLFALQTESREQKDTDEVVHLKLPAYVQNMDRLGDTELDLVTRQRPVSAASTPSRNFFSTLLPQGRRTPAVKAKPLTSASSPSQAAVGRKEQASSQSSKSKDGLQVKATSGGEMSNSQQSTQQTNQPSHSRHKRIQAHEKDRKELFSKPSPLLQDKNREAGEPEPSNEISGEAPDSSSGRSGGGLSAEQPFIKLSQEEYGEHHSSIMHCRVDCSGRRVASLDVDGVIKVWSFNPIMQTNATIMSKSPLLSLEWATKPDRLLLLGSGVGTVRLYDTDTKKNLYEMSIDESHPRILSLACSPSGSSFVCSAAALNGIGLVEPAIRLANPVSGQLLLWDTKTVKQQLQFALEPEPVAINCTAFNHNGNLLVTGAADGVIRLFDMQQYESAMSWKAHDGEVHSVEFSCDENTVFSIGEDGKFVQWNIHRCGVKQAEQILPQDATGPFVLSGYSGYKQVQVPRGRLFAFDSEGQHVLTCSNSGGLIYKLTNNEPALKSTLSLGGHKAPVVTVDWCSALDCGTCLTASMDGKIKLSTILAQKS